MGLDSLFERGVIALEKIATALQQEKAAAEVEAAAKPRGRKPKDTPEAAPAAVVVAPDGTPASVAAPPAAAQKSFLDDEDEAPAAPAVKELTEAEHRAEIRKQMLALQKALDPDRALSILVKHGKAETLKSLKPENFQALYAAIAAAMPKAAA